MGCQDLEAQLWGEGVQERQLYARSLAMTQQTMWLRE